jgi:hypothetical protein
LSSWACLGWVRFCCSRGAENVSITWSPIAPWIAGGTGGSGNAKLHRDHAGRDKADDSARAAASVWHGQFCKGSGGFSGAGDSAADRASDSGGRLLDGATDAGSNPGADESEPDSRFNGACDDNDRFQSLVLAGRSGIAGLPAVEALIEMYVRTGPVRRSRRGLGAVNTAGLVSTGASIGTTAAVSSLATSGTALSAAAGPIGLAAGLAASLLMKLNHPYGTCAPNAPDMASFLKCWSHPIPDNYIPVWTNMWGGSDGKGWVYCSGARKGQPPAGGCAAVGEGGKAYCGPDGVSYLVGSGQRNPSGGPCAPPGTIQSIKGGGYDVAPQAASSSAVTGVPALDSSIAAAGQDLSSLLGTDVTSSTILGLPAWLALALGGLGLFLVVR